MSKLPHPNKALNPTSEQVVLSPAGAPDGRIVGFPQLEEVFPSGLFIVGDLASQDGIEQLGLAFADNRARPYLRCWLPSLAAFIQSS